MTSTNRPKILAVAGSTRTDSFNKQLLRCAAAAAEAAGAEVTVVDLRDLPLPIFDEDLEKSEGTPENASTLKRLMADSQGLLIASPEYNSSISAVLKNAIDWASRRAPGEKPLIAFGGKVVALMSASPGSLGGLRGLVHLRAIFGNLGTIVLPKQVALPGAGSAFAEDGTLADAGRREAVEQLAQSLVDVIRKLHG